MYKCIAVSLDSDLVLELVSCGSTVTLIPVDRVFTVCHIQFSVIRLVQDY